MPMAMSDSMRMDRANLQTSHQTPSPLEPFSPRYILDNDLVELVWKNGEIMMQRQSSSVTRIPILHNQIMGVSVIKNPDSMFSNSGPNKDLSADPTTESLRMSSNLLNLSCFTRPNIPNVEEKVAAGSCNNPIKEDWFPDERAENLFRFKNEEHLQTMVASSSVGSGNGGDGGSSYQHTHNFKRKSCDLDESECRTSDIETESTGEEEEAPARRGNGTKRKRATEVHNLSERRRRGRINERMRALQELIPNCNKVDSVSILDEAIEYLKTLQVQIMSMGAGLFMPQMMFPPGLQHMYPVHLPHFSPLGVGMGMGFGNAMTTDMNGGSPGCPILPVPPMQGGHFPSPMNFPICNLPFYGHPGQP